MSLLNLLKKLILIVFSFSVISLFGQEKLHKYDIQLGVGKVFNTPNKFIANYVIPEANYRINNYLTTNISIGIAPIQRVEHDSRMEISGKANLLFSPFMNYKKNDLKVGIGIGYYGYIRNYADEYTGEIIHFPSHYRTTFTPGKIGLTFVVEDDYRFWNFVVVGMKVFSTAYLDGHYSTAIALKAGIVL